MKLTALDFILPIVFFFLGFFLGKKTRSKPLKEKDTSFCSCSHAYSMHRDEGKCNVVRVNYEYGGYKNYACACIRYDGVPPAHIYMRDS